MLFMGDFDPLDSGIGLGMIRFQIELFVRLLMASGLFDQLFSCPLKLNDINLIKEIFDKDESLLFVIVFK
jgi:hypothetical protein